MNCYIISIKPVIETIGLRDIMLPIRDLVTLENMNPNFSEITAVSEKHDTVGIHAFVFDNERIVCRNFAPRYDVREESATGNSNCALACYLWENKILRKNKYIVSGMDILLERKL